MADVLFPARDVLRCLPGVWVYLYFNPRKLSGEASSPWWMDLVSYLGCAADLRAVAPAINELDIYKFKGKGVFL